MHRRRFLCAAACGLSLPGLGVHHRVNAQPDTRQPFRIYRITFRGRTEVEQGFEDYLSANGVPVEFIDRDIGRDSGRLPALVEEIRQRQPDLVYTWGTSVTLGVVGRYDAVDPARHITAIPVVFALVAAPVQSGIVPALASSGRNVTGAVHVVPTETQVRAMQSYRPFQRLGVLYTPTEQNSVAIVEELRELASRFDFQLIERRFSLDSDNRPVADNVERLVGELREAGAEWFYLLPDTFLGTLYHRVTPAALEQGLPTFGAAELAIREGGALVALISRYYLVGQLAAAKAMRILVQGVPPREIPVETLQRFSLIINMPVARALSFYPPLAMLNYAEVLLD